MLTEGGRIVLVGQDRPSFAVDSDHPGLTTRIVQARANAVRSPRAARSFRGLLLEAGFTEVAVEVHTGVFTDTVPMFVASATKA